LMPGFLLDAIVVDNVQAVLVLREKRLCRWHRDNYYPASQDAENDGRERGGLNIDRDLSLKLSRGLSTSARDLLCVRWIQEQNTGKREEGRVGAGRADIFSLSLGHPPTCDRVGLLDLDEPRGHKVALCSMQVGASLAAPTKPRELRWLSSGRWREGNQQCHSARRCDNGMSTNLVLPCLPPEPSSSSKSN
jgi:hypothetical protein